MAWKGSAKSSVPKGARASRWVGFAPHGAGEQQPNRYRVMAKIVWKNRRNLPYAWRILSKGACDGCALGAAGLHDWTVSGVHLCTKRLNLLEVNTMKALDPDVLGDVGKLCALSDAELRDLGRLPHPMVRRRGEQGFARVSWDEALDLVADRMRAKDPDSFALCLTERGVTNEVSYVAQKLARVIGTNNVDNAARVAHAPSTAALERTIGVAAATCSYTDLIGSDLIVLFGADAANEQPVLMKYLFLARTRGAKVVVVNPTQEPGLDHGQVPTTVDEHFGVRTAGEIAFLNGVLKVMLAVGGVDRRFVREHTTGFDQLLQELEAESFKDLEEQSGATREDMTRFARMYAGAPSAVLVWSTGITRQANGIDTVTAIVNLALARGNVGRKGAGLMPIRGHAGGQGASEMGASATAFPGGLSIDASSAAALSETYGIPISAREGMTVDAMVEAGARGRVEVLYSSGGSFRDVLPGQDAVHDALERVPVRVHQDIVLSSQMLVDPGEVVVLLPASTRYEQPGGVTETTTERRILFSPEIPGPRIGEARSGWEVFADLGRRVRPDRAELLGFKDADAVRDEIARVVPTYSGIEQLQKLGDAVQWGGTQLCADGVFPTADGRAKFTAVAPTVRDRSEGTFVLSTRRGRRFSTMVSADGDPRTGSKRDALFVGAKDAGALGLKEGAAVLVRSEHGEMDAKVHVAPVRPGNVQVYFPEGNVLLPRGRLDPESGVPDDHAIVEILPR